MNSNGNAEQRRPIERDLNAVVTLDKWRAICAKAADDALAGDARARDWLAKWLLEAENRPLTTLAAEESEITPEAATEAELEARRQTIEVKQQERENYRRLLARSTSKDLQRNKSN
ncbi:MAG: hypothetical protein WCJ35_25490 [Planctomycetota bacterium]